MKREAREQRAVRYSASWSAGKKLIMLLTGRRVSEKRSKVDSGCDEDVSISKDSSF